MSASARRPLRKTQEPPPKKSKTGLIILIVVIIVVVLAVGITIAIILWRRSQSSSSGGGGGGGGTIKCSTNTDCPSGKVCNTSTGVCVACVANSDCPSGTPVCNNGTCVECTTSANCTDPIQPVCSANVCVDCTTDAECSGNTHYASLGHNFCQNKSCVECKVDTDCTAPAACVTGACCDLTPATLTGMSTTIGATDNISATFTYTQTPANVKYKLLVGARIAGFTASVTGPTMTVTLFDATQFALAVGQTVYGPNFSQAAKIISLGTGTGATGTYTLDTSMTAASGPVESIWILYTSPAALTTAASPQSISINDTEFGRRLEPNSVYYSIIELTVTCGTTPKTTVSKPTTSSTASFGTLGPDSPACSIGYVNTVPTSPATPNISGSPGAYVFNTSPDGCGSGYTISPLYGAVSQWTGVSPPLFGVLPGTQYRTDAYMDTAGLYTWGVNHIPFSLTPTSGTMIYAYMKAWGSNGPLCGTGCAFTDWIFALNAPIP